MTIPPQPARYTAFYCEENIYHLVASLQSSAGESGRGTRVYAVFISNAQRKSLLFHQKAADPEQGYVIWDYHVVAVTVTPRAGSGDEGVEANEVVRVFDPDSNLDDFEGGPQDGHNEGAANGFDFDDYVQETFRPDLYAPGGVIRTIFELDEPRFRVVPADKFLWNFASDRSHMLLESTSQSSAGSSSPPALQYFKPVPAWEAIVGEGARSRGETNNLFSHWLDMDDGEPATRTRSKHYDEPFGRVFSLESFAGRSDWIGAAWMGQSGREQAYTTPLAEGFKKKLLPESAAYPSPLLYQPVPLSISASPHGSTSEKPSHLAQKAEKTVQRALVPVPPEEINREEPSSTRWSSYLPPRQLMISIFVSLGINFAIPFVNGVMLGFGEIFARDWFAPWVGLTSWSTSHYRRAASMAPHRIGIRVAPNPNPHPEHRGGKGEVPGHPSAKSIVETAAEQVVAGSV